MALRHEQEAFQNLLEHILFSWSQWDDDDRSQALEDLGKARRAVEVAWLDEIGVITNGDDW